MLIETDLISNSNLLNDNDNITIKATKKHRPIEITGNTCLNTMLDLLSQQEPIKTTNIMIDLQARKQLIMKQKAFLSKNKLFSRTLHLSIFLMDIIINKERQMKLDHISISCFLLAVKYIDIDTMVPGIKRYQTLFDPASSYTTDQIRKFEIKTLKKLKYKLDYITPAYFIELFYYNRVIVNSDKSLPIKCHPFREMIGILEGVLMESIKYLEYNQFYLACAILAKWRLKHKMPKWPEEYNKMYNVTAIDFEKEYEYVITVGRTSLELKNISRSISKRNSHSKGILLNSFRFNDQSVERNESSTKERRRITISDSDNILAISHNTIIIHKATTYKKCMTITEASTVVSKRNPPYKEKESLSITLSLTEANTIDKAKRKKRIRFCSSLPKSDSNNFTNVNLYNDYTKSTITTIIPIEENSYKKKPDKNTSCTSIRNNPSTKNHNDILKHTSTINECSLKIKSIRDTNCIIKPMTSSVNTMQSKKSIIYKSLNYNKDKYRHNSNEKEKNSTCENSLTTTAKCSEKKGLRTKSSLISGKKLNTFVINE